FRPFIQLQICPGFVDKRPLPAQLLPAKIGRGDILHRVVAHGLVFRTGVARSKVKELVVRGIGTDTEGDSSEAGSSYAGRSVDLRVYVDLDRAVAELRSVDQREGRLVHCFFGETDGFAASILDGLGLHTGWHGEVLGVGQREALRWRDGCACVMSLCTDDVCGGEEEQSNSGMRELGRSWHAAHSRR